MAPTQDKFWTPVQLFYDFADKEGYNQEEYLHPNVFSRMLQFLG